MSHLRPPALDPFTKVVLSLTAGLQDPLHPGFCPGCLRRLAGEMIEPNGQADAEFADYLLHDHHAFMTRSIAFIVAMGNLDTAARARVGAALLTRVRKCRESRDGDADDAPKMRNVHRVVMERMQRDALWDSVDVLSNIVGACMAGQHRHPTRRFTRGIWPASVDDMLPGGADTAVAGLCGWIRRLPFPEQDQLFITNVRFMFMDCRTELGRPPYSVLLADALREHMAVLVRRGPDPRSLVVVADFIFDLFVGEGSIPDTHAWAPLAPRLLDALDAGLRVTSDSNARVALAKIGRLMSALCPDRPVHPLIRQFAFDRTKNRFQLLHHRFVLTMERRACGWLPCSRTEREIGRNLSVCAGCRVYRYCSKECQRAHWKAGHKNACTGINNLWAQLGREPTVDVSERVFVELCRRTLRDADLLAVARLYGQICMDDARMHVTDADALAQWWLSLA